MLSPSPSLCLLSLSPPLCPFYSRGEDYRARIPRKICFGLMGPFRRVNALVRLENARARATIRKNRNVSFSRRESGKTGERERKNEREDTVYWKLADIKWRGAEFMDSGETVSWNRQIKQKSSRTASRNRSYWREGCKFLEI